VEVRQRWRLIQNRGSEQEFALTFFWSKWSRLTPAAADQGSRCCRASGRQHHLKVENQSGSSGETPAARGKPGFRRKAAPLWQGASPPSRRQHQDGRIIPIFAPPPFCQRPFVPGQIPPFTPLRNWCQKYGPTPQRSGIFLPTRDGSAAHQLNLALCQKKGATPQKVNLILCFKASVLNL